MQQELREQTNELAALLRERKDYTEMARLRGERGHSAPPLGEDIRRAYYLKQGGTLTGKQQRRLQQKARRNSS